MTAGDNRKRCRERAGIPGENAVEDMLPVPEHEVKRSPDKRLAKSLLIMLLIAVGYVCIYLSGRVIWCDLDQGNLAQWLFTAKPTGKDSYLYGWLLSSDMFWYAVAISVIPTLFGKYKFSLITLIGFVIGFIAGIVFGPYPEGASQGNDHCGWAIWGVAYLTTMVAGVFVERHRKNSDGSVGCHKGGNI